MPITLKFAYVIISFAFANDENNCKLRCPLKNIALCFCHKIYLAIISTLFAQTLCGNLWMNSEVSYTTGDMVPRSVVLISQGCINLTC